MPSRAYTPFLPRIPIQELKQHLVCQCPLGLIPHFYWSQSFSLMHITCASVSMPSRAYTPFLPTTYTSYKDVCRSVNALSGLYPISTMILSHTFIIMNPRVNALSGLYPISTVPLQKPRFYAVFRACFCRYLSEYSDNSRFSCMLTFWTYLMRCTYP